MQCHNPLAGRHDEVGFVLVVVERTAPDEVLRAVLLQLDAPALHQRHASRSGV